MLWATCYSLQRETHDLSYQRNEGLFRNYIQSNFMFLSSLCCSIKALSWYLDAWIISIDDFFTLQHINLWVHIEATRTPECQEGIPSQGGHQREEQRVVHRVQEEHNEGHIQWAWVKVNGVHSSGNSPLQINMLEWTMNHEQKPEPNHSPNHEQNHKQNQEQNHEPWTMNHIPGLDSIDHPV